MGSVERRHRHLVDTTVTLIQHTLLPQKYWDYVVMTATFLYNLNPSVVLGGKSPFEILFGTSPNYSKLKVFGCKSFPCLRSYRHSKLDPKSTPCVFIGYPANHDSYLCLDPDSGKIYISRDVKFLEE